MGGEAGREGERGGGGHRRAMFEVTMFSRILVKFKQFDPLAAAEPLVQTIVWVGAAILATATVLLR